MRHLQRRALAGGDGLLHRTPWTIRPATVTFRPVSSDFSRIGGEAALRAIIDDFVRRVFADAMIGFFFRNASEDRLRELEYQHAAEHLGGGVTYRGRPLRVAHGPHRIMGGHFERRQTILSDVLIAHGVDEAVRARWLAHTESLRGEITSDPGSECR